MANGYPSPYGNIRNESWLANLGWDTGINPALTLPQTLSPEQLYGQNFDFLRENVRPIVAGGMDPVLAELLGIQTNTINKQAGEARRSTRENLASSGFRGSGANLMSNIFREQADATQAASANIGAMGLQNKQFYANLLNSMNQFQGAANLDNAKYQTGAFQNMVDLLSGNAIKKKAAEEAEGFDWGSFGGNILNAGATIGAAALMAPSDKRLKKDIKDTGMKTESGIPVKTFSYKDDKSGKTFIGHLAQDVEKKHPEAVYKVIDYSKLPEGIFREVN